VVLDESSVRRLIVVYLREAHAPLGLLVTVADRALAAHGEEVGSANAPLLQCPQHLLLILADEAVDQHRAVLLLRDREAGCVLVWVTGAERLKVTVVPLHTFEGAKNTVDRAISTHS
jgi:hypothetical protein